MGVRWQKCFEDGEETNIWHVVANIYGGGDKTFFSIVEWKTNLGCDDIFFGWVLGVKRIWRGGIPNFYGRWGGKKVEWGYTNFFEVDW